VLSAQRPDFGWAFALSVGNRAVTRVCAYIDGFNFYYGAVKDTPFKWINPLLLCQQFLPAQHNIQKIKYFTARVSGAANPTAPQRQQIYFDALATLPQVELHFGRFLPKNKWRPITNLPVANATIHSPVAVSLPAGTHNISGLARAASVTVGSYAIPGSGRPRTVTPLADALVTQVHDMEEKGSDVNLASHLLNDAWKNLFDQAVVISNDTDLVEPIGMVTVERKKPVVVVCPGKYQMAPTLRAVASFKIHLRRAMLAASQFPSPIPGTAITKPATW
jgi:hypothetical protein